MTDEDGKPVELGCGAKGVTYKAFDVDLPMSCDTESLEERGASEEQVSTVFQICQDIVRE